MSAVIEEPQTSRRRKSSEGKDSANSVAAHLTISGIALHKLYDEGVITNIYNKDIARRDYISYLRGEQGSTNATLRDEKTRLTRAQASRVEFETDLQTGKAIWIDELRDELVRRFTGVKVKLLSLPTKLAPRVLGMKSVVDVEDELKAGIYEALQELGNGDDVQVRTVQAAQGMDRRGKSIHASAKTNRVSLGRRKKKAKS